MADLTPPTLAPTPPEQNWFARLDPAWRAVIVLALSTAVSVVWNKFFPGVPVPLPAAPPAPAAPGVLVLNVGPPANPPPVGLTAAR